MGTFFARTIGFSGMANLNMLSEFIQGANGVAIESKFMMMMMMCNDLMCT